MVGITGGSQSSFTRILAIPSYYAHAETTFLTQCGTCGIYSPGHSEQPRQLSHLHFASQAVLSGAHQLKHLAAGCAVVAGSTVAGAVVSTAVTFMIRAMVVAGADEAFVT